MRISGHDVIRAVCAHYRLSREELTGPDRQRAIARPRQVAFYLMREICPHLSQPAIGRTMGGRDHTTVIHGVRNIKSLLPVDPSLQADVDALRAALTAPAPASGWGIYEPQGEAMRRAA